MELWNYGIMELWNYGFTESRIGRSRLMAHSLSILSILSILFEDYGQQTTDNGGYAGLTELRIYGITDRAKPAHGS